MKKLLLLFIGVLFMTGSSWGQVTNFPYTENFNGIWTGNPVAPAGWSQIKVSGGNIHWINDWYDFNVMAAVSFPDGYAGEYLLITPGFDFSQKNYRLKFKLRGSRQSGSAHNNLMVQIAGSNASAGNFTNTLVHYETGVNMPVEVWEDIIIDLSPYKGVQYIAFRMISNRSYTEFGIDDVIIEEIAPATSFWTGAISNDWANAGNWNGSSIPGSTTNVTIPVDVPNYPTISSAAYCNTITLKSDAVGTASLLGNEMLTITTASSAKVERYITGGWGAWDYGWHHISSPVAGQAIEYFETNGVNNDYDFYGWEETNDTWMNQKDLVGFIEWNDGANFNEGQGYLVSYEALETEKSFTGDFYTENITKTGLTKSGDKYRGWNLLGNPFASALTWNDGNWILGDVAGVSKIWTKAGGYTDISADGIIPMAQGFMVQVNTETSLTIPAASRVHNSQAFYKSANEQILLVAAETESILAQESRIIVNSMATEGFDFEYDSRFLAGYAPEFYSVVGDEYLSTNSLPSIDAGLVIPFRFVKNDASDYTITLKESMAGRVVYLTDNQTGKMTNLSENPVYSFTSNDGDDANRFSVTFGSLGINNPEAAEAINVYAYGNVLYLETPSKEAALVNVYTLTGQLVMQANIVGNSLNTLNASELSNGIYVVNVMLNNAVVSRKVSIHK